MKRILFLLVFSLGILSGCGNRIEAVDPASVPGSPVAANCKIFVIQSPKPLYDVELAMVCR